MKTEELFVLENFEGTIDFLLNLIQQEEISIQDVSLRTLTSQFLAFFDREKSPEIDSGAEFIATAAFLVWLKSKTLLPQHEQSCQPDEEESDPRFAIIHQLLDYCRFKDAAKALEEREVSQSAYYLRGVESQELQKNLGIDHLSLEDLAGLFKEILTKVQTQKGSIHEEEWKVSDKVSHILSILYLKPQLPFEELFTFTMGRLELIVTFLALLELMKRGALRVVRHTQVVMIERTD